MLMSLEELRGMATDIADAGDEALTQALAAASGLIEARLGRKLLKGDYTYSQLLPEGRVVLLDAWPVTEVRAVKIDGAATERWLLDAERGIILLDRPPHALVAVEYTGGLDYVPVPIRQAVALTALAIHSSVEHKGQTLMSERLGDYQEMYYNAAEGKTISAALSPAAEALIAPWRRVR